MTAARTRSGDYTVTVIRPPRVERIDLPLRASPRGLGLEPRTDEDSGDIYGPAGTKVRLSITRTSRSRARSLRSTTARRLPLTANASCSTARADDRRRRLVSRRAARSSTVSRTPATPSTSSARWTIGRRMSRSCARRRQAGDAARRSADRGARRRRLRHRVARSRLSDARAARRRRSAPRQPRGLDGRRAAHAVHGRSERPAGRLRDLLRAGARRSRGRRSTEARSDIFFLEVKPFEEEFVAAQSQQGAGRRQAAGGLEDLAEAQKEIIVATWKLDARARRAQGASPQDIKAVSEGAGRVARPGGAGERADARAGRSAPRRGGRRGRAGRRSDRQAVEAMGRAVVELDKLSTSARCRTRWRRSISCSRRRREPPAPGDAIAAGGRRRRAESLRSGSLDPVRSGTASGKRPTTKRRLDRRARGAKHRTIRSSRFASSRAGRTRSIASSAISREIASR